MSEPDYKRRRIPESTAAYAAEGYWQGRYEATPDDLTQRTHNTRIARTHARTHAPTHARTHARTHKRIFHRYTHA